MPGCSDPGPKLVPVRGKVLIESRGPVFPGSIWFIPEPGGNDLEASSLLQKDGSFRLRTYPHGDGALIGKYKVTLSLGAGSPAELARYSRPSTTPLKVVVPESGWDDLVLTLEQGPMPGQSEATRKSRGTPAPGTSRR